MEHLSAEERACLMFLEETIESLEVEEDSGVSNDEPDHLSHNLTNRVTHLSSISQVDPEGEYEGPHELTFSLGKKSSIKRIIYCNFFLIRLCIIKRP